ADGLPARLVERPSQLARLLRRLSFDVLSCDDGRGNTEVLGVGVDVTVLELLVDDLGGSDVLAEDDLVAVVLQGLRIQLPRDHRLGEVLGSQGEFQAFTLGLYRSRTGA